MKPAEGFDMEEPLESIEDFFRNFLVRQGMHKTLDMFEQEYFELKQKGQIVDSSSEPPPDAFTYIRQLEDEIAQMKTDVAEYAAVAKKAKGAHGELKRERDYHRMNHRRMAQERQKVTEELNRTQKHYIEQSEQLAALHEKYEVVLRQRTMAKMQRDKLASQTQNLQSSLRNIQIGFEPDAAYDSPPTAKVATPVSILKKTEQERRIEATVMPVVRAAGPSVTRPPPSMNCITRERVKKIELKNSFKAHTQGVSALAYHPENKTVASVSDDSVIKVWSVPSGETLFDATGHTEWISAVDFHPGGGHIATGSADKTAKVWDLNHTACVATLSEHAHTVWSCAFHFTGHFLATGSMDTTSKIWDLNTLKCMHTLRGHKDSVNSIGFQYHSNTVVTSGADKMVALWDARTGIQSRSMLGHENACRHATFNRAGDTVASCDADGVIVIWEVRTGDPLATISTGGHSASKCNFDATGNFLGVACDDRVVRIYDVQTQELVRKLEGHTDVVEDVVFDPLGDFIVSASGDCSIRIWG